jgi:hypothetical protein
MPKGKERYKVDANPFTPAESIDPFQNPQAPKRRVEVDGFKKLDEIKKKIQEGRQRNVPVFVLVKGPQGAGRRSMEYAVLDLWRQMLNVEVNRFARVRAKAKSESESDLVREWIGDLVVRLNNFQGLPIDQGRIRDLESAVGLDNLLQMRLKLKMALPHIISEMSKAKPSPFEIGASFSEIRPKMLDEVCSIFDGLPKICILIFSQKDPPDPDLRIDIDCQIVDSELGPLSREDIATLIAARWGDVSKVPFSVEAVQDFYDAHKPHVGLILTRLSKLFDLMCAAHANEGGVWPDDETLFYDADQVRATLMQIETRI